MPIGHRLLTGVKRVARSAKRMFSRSAGKKSGVEVTSSRRKILGTLATLPLLGMAAPARKAQGAAAASDSAREKDIIITAADSQAYRRLKALDLTAPEALAKQEQMPTGTIGNLKLGRLISGSNLISMNMHSRDLKYVKNLAGAYNTKERIFMTLKACEELGGNSIVLKDHNFKRFELEDYWTEWGGKMLWHADVITTEIDQFERRLEQHLELNASTVYLWGGASDIWYHQGKQDNIIKAYEMMRNYDVPVGIGAHRLEPIVFCEREGLQPDYYIKTLHHDQYWSAHPVENRTFLEMFQPESPLHHEYHDNMFCHNHQETIDFMQDVNVPWIAFKVLAAGAIPAPEGIQYAFDNGADFICLGMFDFQVEEDARLIRDCVARARIGSDPGIEGVMR